MRSRRGLSSGPGAVVAAVPYSLYAEDPELLPHRAAATCHRCSNVDDLIPTEDFFLCRECKTGGRRLALRRNPGGLRFKPPRRPRPRVGYLAS